MKTNTIMIFLFLTLALSCVAKEQIKTPIPVEYVNPKSFSGLWYEIARTYNSFEKDCVASTIEYKLSKKNEYKVFNRCFKNKIGNKLIVYKGVAKALEKNSMAEIKKTYFWVFSKVYMVLYLDDYKTAVICDEKMDNVWIMHRTPFLQKQKLDFVVSILKQYMDTSRLIYTKQDKNGRYK